MAKFSCKKHLVLALATAIGFGGVFAYADYDIYNYANENQIFDQDKINDDLDFYGGDERYVGASKDLLQRESSLYNHFNIEANRPVKIGFSSDITEHEREQFTHTINYIDSVFKVINPEYSFEIVDEPSYKCDVYIDKKPLEKHIGAYVNLKKDIFNKNQVVGGNIHFNSTIESSDTQLRFFLAHEFMHIFFGTGDIDYTKSRTFSLYNYNDIGYINYLIENAHPTQEDADNSYGIKKPVLTEEEKDSFITYTPTDISTLIAIYGDSTKPENREAYINLINETLEKCSNVFGDYQPYYEEGFEVPSPTKNNISSINEDLTF